MERYRWTGRWSDGRKDSWKDRRTDRRQDKRTNRPTDRLERQTDRRTYRPTAKQTSYLDTALRPVQDYAVESVYYDDPLSVAITIYIHTYIRLPAGQNFRRNNRRNVISGVVITRLQCIYFMQSATPYFSRFTHYPRTRSLTLNKGIGVCCQMCRCFICYGIHMNELSYCM